MGAVTRVDYGNFQVPCYEIGSAGRRMAHDEAVRAHGVEIVGGIEKGFPFFQAGSFGLKIHGIRAEARRGGRKTQSRAGGIFEECKSDGFAAEGGKFLKRVALDFLERYGLIQEKSDFFRGERL